MHVAQGIRLEPLEHHLNADAVLLGQCLKGVALRTIPHQHKAPAGPHRLWQGSEGPDQQVETLLRNKPRHCKNLEIAGCRPR